MRVLMLGWEFPPYISGGLGTACYGLTKALSRRGVDVLFVLPKAVDASHAGHVRLLSPQSAAAAAAGDEPTAERIDEVVQSYELAEFEHVQFKAIPSRIVSPYGQAQPVSQGEMQAERKRQQMLKERGVPQDDADAAANKPKVAHLRAPNETDYAGDMMTETQRYADLAVSLARHEEFDVVHAHDWMTYPAGLAIAARYGKPLVVHVHSTEYDRSGENIHQQIADIERRGMQGAMSIITVSYLTRNIAVHRYGIDEKKIEVVYNGIDTNGPMMPTQSIAKGDRIVLFLGRITMQKGPEYFVTAAKKVLEKVENVKFVMAGSGDMAERVIRMAAEMGIGHKVLFTGFLRGDNVARVFRMADVYVMPSVSEPFGIAPLEAIRHDVPVIISRNSGVAEVLKHALKVDFWDTDDMANKIIAVLRHPPLSQTLREHADLEVRALTWDGAAQRCEAVYQHALQAMHQPSVPMN